MVARRGRGRAQRPLQRAAQKAAAAQKGLFSPSYCGVGPNEGHPVRVWANWDADGSDRQNVNGEWVKIRNYDPVNPLPLDGWYVRDSSLRRFTFPAGTAFPPNSSITVYAGQGENFGSEFFWNLTRPVFDNTTRDDRGKGDGAYLFDPQGDLRAWMISPATSNAQTRTRPHLDRHPPAEGGVDLAPQHRTRPIHFEAYLSRPALQLLVPARLMLGPGETMRISTQGDPANDTAFDKYWGMTSQILNNGGDIGRSPHLHRRDDRLHAYGSKSC